MQLVKGFTDILAPQNLATNGNFRINQRGLFNASLDPCKVGDYVADCWYIGSNTVDTLSCINRASMADAYSIRTAGLNFFGSGKKGQTFSIICRDIPRFFPENPHLGPEAIYFTATVRARAVPLVNSDANVTIPYTVSVLPPRNSGFWGYRTNKNASINMKRSVNYVTPQQAISCIYTGSNYDIFLPAEITITLQADGEFAVVLSDFALYNASYNNPPEVSFVHPAEDLLRCKRYYQTLNYSEHSRGIQIGPNFSRHASTCLFPVEMAGTPSVVLSTSSVRVFTGADANFDVIGTIPYVANTGSKSIALFTDINDATFGPRAIAYGADISATIQLSI